MGLLEVSLEDSVMNLRCLIALPDRFHESHT
jgi:hypothetical protein